jgi:hypothetical protein
MVKGLIRIADAKADGLDLARDSMVLERAIKVAQNTLYRVNRVPSYASRWHE